MPALVIHAIVDLLLMIFGEPSSYQISTCEVFANQVAQPLTH